jgi:hypothetical protein
VLTTIQPKIFVKEGFNLANVRFSRAVAEYLTLYRHVAPDGTLRKDGLKVVEGGNIRSGKKK